MKSVSERHFPDETGAFRTQQVGVLCAIYSLQRDNELPTVAKIREIYGGLTQSQAMRIINRLVERDLIERISTPILTTGRGKILTFKIKETEEFKALVRGMQR